MLWMLLKRTQPSWNFRPPAPSWRLIWHPFSSFIFCLSLLCLCSPTLLLSWIVSSVQTCCLYCRFDSFLVRLTVTTDSFNLLSLLLLLELLFLALTLAFNMTIDTHLVDLVGSCLFSGVPIRLVYCSSWVDYSDCVSLLPLRLPHPQGACNQSFVHFGSFHWAISHSWFIWHLFLLFWSLGSQILVGCCFGSVGLLVCLGAFLVSPHFSDFGCRVATLLNPFTVPLLEDLLLALSLTSTQTLVSYSSSSSPKHLRREVLCDYPAVKGMGYWEVEGVCAGMAVLNPEYQDAHNKENQSYVGISCGFGLTYQSETRKVQGYCYLCALGRGSNMLLPPWFASKA